jgi:hemoglobin
MKNTLLLAGLAGTLLLGSCGKKEEAAEPTLYDRLGQTEGIAKIVDGLIANVGAETATPNLLAAISSQNGQPATDPQRLQRLRNNFIDQVGEATGGPLKYKGMNMLTAHTGMHITATEFSVWHKQLEASLASNNVAETDKAALYAIIDKMEGDVVGH